MARARRGRTLTTRDGDRRECDGRHTVSRDSHSPGPFPTRGHLLRDRKDSSGGSKCVAVGRRHHRRGLGCPGSPPLCRRRPPRCAVSLADPIAKLLINVPPGCMKSYLVSVFWPAWEWATNGGLRVFTASFGAPLSIRDNRRMRDIVTSDWYRRQYHVELREDQNQKHRYDTTAQGWRIASSVGGIGMGEHPDRIIIDDPHNPRQAESDVERQAAIQWFDLTIGTRGVSRAVKLVVIMQRLHERDLSGHILERADAADWTHLCLPMRYEAGRQPTTVIGWTDPRHEVGALLWPALFNDEKLAGIEAGMDAYARAGQLQQSPAPPGGALFQRQWFDIVGARPTQVDARCRFWDCAATAVSATAKDPDWTVGGAGGARPGRVLHRGPHSRAPVAGRS